MSGRNTAILLVLAGATGIAILAWLGSRPAPSPRTSTDPAPRSTRTLPGARPTGVPILLIGLDGADWAAIRPLAAEGALPHFRDLMERGAHGVLRSEKPMLSPILWTTIATGRGPLDHGVLDFLEVDPASGATMPVSARQRHVPAVWDLFSAAGLDVAVVAWWASWPAYPTSGRIVSDRVAYTGHRFDTNVGEGDGLFYPAEMEGKLRHLHVEPGEVTREQIAPLASVPESRFRDADAALEAGSSPFSDPLNHLRQTVAATRTYHRMAVALLEDHQPSLFAVYYQGLDEVKHQFAHCRAPALPSCPPELAWAFGGTIDAFYRLQDELLGELIDRVSPETVIVLASDHGFHTAAGRPAGLSPDRREGRASRWHRPAGIPVLAGPPIVPGPMPPAGLRDVAPTLLFLGGLPLAETLDGTPTLAAIRPDFRAAHPPIAAPSYAPWELATEVQAATLDRDADREALEKLTALGYLAPGDPATSEGLSDKEAVYATVRRLTTEAALWDMEGDVAQARRLLRRALDLLPDHLPGQLMLAQLYQRQGENEDALRLYRRALPDAWRRAPETYLMAAECFRAAGLAVQGLNELAPIAREHPETTPLHLAVAILQRSSGRTEEAEATLRRILERQPADVRAMANLVLLLEVGGRVDEAAPLIRRALEADPESASHHKWLGQIAESHDQIDQAARHYARANQAAPEWLEPLLGLGRVAARSGRLDAAIEMFRGTVERFPRAPEAPFHLAGALEMSGDLEGARSAYLEAEHRGMRDVELFRRLGALAAGRGDLDEARSYYERAVEIDPDRQGLRRELEALGGRGNQ